MPLKLRRSDLLDFYRRYEEVPKPKLAIDLQDFTASTFPLGLGDTLLLTSMPRVARAQNRTVRIYSRSQHFRVLCKFNPYYRPGFSSLWAFAHPLAESYNLGNGHFIQRIQRAFHFEPEELPNGCICVADRSRRRDTVVMHFEPGRSVELQRRYIHPRAREVYPSTFLVLQQFVNAHPEMNFAEVGTKCSGLAGVEDWTGLDLENTILRMATCEIFVGINSGPMHLAAALGLRLITIINFPDPALIYLPVIKDLGVVDMEWLYPQSVHLHQDGEGPLVPRVSLPNLESALNGDVYPYWSHDYLDLITEKE